MAIQFGRSQGNATGNGSGTPFYDYMVLNIFGDGSTKTVSISLTDAPFSLQFSKSNALTSAVVAFADSSFGTTTAAVSGTTLTITFTNAPAASLIVTAVQLYLLYEAA